MSYEGREQLVLSCMEILQSLKQDYIDQTKLLVKDSQKYIDLYELDDTLSLIFDSIFQKTYDEETIKKSIYKCFENDENYAKYIVLYSMFHLLHKFSITLKEKYPNLLDHIVYLQNAIESFQDIFRINKTQNKDISYSSSNSIKFSSSGGGFVFFGNLIDELKRMHSQNEELLFLNLYNGVNVECKSRIVSIDDDKVVCKVNLMQILAMKEEGNAFIVKSGSMVSNIKADIASINLTNDTVTIKNFTHMEKMFASQRKYPRVHPNKFTKVMLSNGDGLEVQGKLFDISQGGIGVVSMDNPGFKNGENIRAKFSLIMPKSDENIDVDLELKLVVALNYQGSMRYCCQIINEQPITQKIVEFSKLRVEETLEELKEKVALYK